MGADRPYGLHATPFDQIANWAFVDWMLNFGEETIQSTITIRQTRCIPTVREGTHRGIDAIRAELQAMAQMVPSTTADVKNLFASGETVMVERVDVFEMMGKTFDVEISGVCSQQRWADHALA